LTLVIAALPAPPHPLRVEKGINFSVQMGLNSGEVVVGTIRE
jgi:hypothetical protein